MVEVGRSLSIVGGGVIGLTCALSAADAGWRVTVFDDPRSAEPGRSGAGWVAAGMLGSLGEGHPGEDALFGMSRESVRRWPVLLDRLADPAVLTASDSLFVAASAADAAHLAQLAEFVWSRQGFSDSELQPIDARGIRAAEGALSSRLVGGYRARGEGAVDNRRLLGALRAAVVDAGVIVVRRRITGLADVPGDRVLVAAGLGAATLLPGEIELYAAKGEVLRLAMNRWSVPPPTHVVRARLHGRSVYLVPRADGIVVGATQYEPIDLADTRPRVGGVADLLTDAIEVLPALTGYDLVEAGTGFRPATADGLPVVRAVDDRVLLAAGHGRNGILLAPWTAARVLDILDGLSPDDPPRDPTDHTAERIRR